MIVFVLGILYACTQQNDTVSELSKTETITTVQLTDQEKELANKLLTDEDFITWIKQVHELKNQVLSNTSNLSNEKEEMLLQQVSEKQRQGDLGKNNLYIAFLGKEAVIKNLLERYLSLRKMSIRYAKEKDLANLSLPVLEYVTQELCRLGQVILKTFSNYTLFCIFVKKTYDTNTLNGGRKGRITSLKKKGIRTQLSASKQKCFF